MLAISAVFDCVSMATIRPCSLSALLLTVAAWRPFSHAISAVINCGSVASIRPCSQSALLLTVAVWRLFSQSVLLLSVAASRPLSHAWNQCCNSMWQFGGNSPILAISAVIDCGSVASIRPCPQSALLLAVAVWRPFSNQCCY